MRYLLAELVQASGYPVDTIRYYQTIGILPPPGHEGRHAVYDESHFERLRLVRSMSQRGLSLKVIGMLLRRGGALDSDQALLAAIEEEATEPSYSSTELARHLGVPAAIVASVEATGIAEIGGEPGERRYSEADLGAARGALKLLGYGFPLTKLIALAVRHDRATRRTVDDAIELFDACVRKKRQAGDVAEDPEATARAFKEILPVVTALIVHHFQRLLVRRALRRLRTKGEKGPLEHAVKVAAKTRLGVRWA